MVRNPEIQEIFVTADDSLHGVMGHHFYVMALYQSIDDPEKIGDNLPKVSGKAELDASPVAIFPMTFSWIRYYVKHELINTYRRPFFELYLSRLSLTTIVSVFDDALDKFVTKLEHLGYHLPLEHGKKLHKWHRQRIKWAFSESKEATIGDLEAVKRLSKTFGIVEEARRLRNLIVHNHGIFNKHYEEEVNKTFEGIEKIIHPDYRDSGKPIAVILNHQDILNVSMAHIEVLHILHNQLQMKYFKHNDPYSYDRERKIIKWNSAFWGNAELDNAEQAFSRKSYLDIE